MPASVAGFHGWKFEGKKTVLNKTHKTHQFPKYQHATHAVILEKGRKKCPQGSFHFRNS